jgi:putative thioredoxin
MPLIGETTPAKAPADLIKEGSDATFVADVIEASRAQPVIVDFWATWCGPCRQLTPALEKAVLAAKGKLKLVKIDVDKNPVYAGQLRVQSIPTVYAFADGKPVDGFMGALPDSQIKAFMDKCSPRRRCRKSMNCSQWQRSRSTLATSAERPRPLPRFSRRSRRT